MDDYTGLSFDDLYSIALHSDYQTIKKMCITSSQVKKQICESANFWYTKTKQDFNANDQEYNTITEFYGDETTYLYF